jgi:hypothetical protein
MDMMRGYWLFCRHHPRLMGGCVGAYALTLCALLCVIVALVPHQAKASALAHIRTVAPVQVSLEEIRGPSLDPGFEWTVMSIPSTQDTARRGRHRRHHIKHQYPAQAHGLSLITANLVWAPPGRVFEGGEPAVRLVMATALQPAAVNDENQSAVAYSGSPAANADVEQVFSLMAGR